MRGGVGKAGPFPKLRQIGLAHTQPGDEGGNVIAQLTDDVQLTAFRIEGEAVVHFLHGPIAEQSLKQRVQSLCFDVGPETQYPREGQLEKRRQALGDA